MEEEEEVDWGREDFSLAKSEEKVGVEEKERERGRPSTVIIALLYVKYWCGVLLWIQRWCYLFVPLFVSCVSMMSLK